MCVEVEVRTPRSLNARLGFAVVRLARDVSFSGSQAHHGHKLASLTLITYYGWMDARENSPALLEQNTCS